MRFPFARRCRRGCGRRLRFGNGKIEMIAAGTALTHDARGKQRRDPGYGHQEGAVHQDSECAGKPGNEQRQRGKEIRLLHAGSIEAMAHIEREQEEEHADHERRTQPAERQRRACEREQHGKHKARPVALCKASDKERADEQRPRRTEHGEEAQPEGTVAEDERSECKQILTQHAVHALPFIDIAFAVIAAFPHFGDRHQRDRLLSGHTVEAARIDGGDILTVDERPGARSGFVRRLADQLRRRVHGRGNDVIFPRPFGGGSVGRNTFAHKYDLIDPDVARERRQPDVRIGSDQPARLGRAHLHPVVVHIGAQRLPFLRIPGGKIGKFQIETAPGRRTCRRRRAGDHLGTQRHAFADGGICRADVDIDVPQAQIDRGSRAVLIRHRRIRHMEDDGGRLRVARTLGLEFKALARAAEGAEHAQPDAQKNERNGIDEPQREGALFAFVCVCHSKFLPSIPYYIVNSILTDNAAIVNGFQSEFFKNRNFCALMGRVAPFRQTTKARGKRPAAKKNRPASDFKRTGPSDLVRITSFP